MCTFQNTCTLIVLNSTDCQCADGQEVMQCSINVFSMLNLGHILISDLVIANLFMHSLPGMILLYFATPFYTKRCFCMRYCIISFGFMHMHCYRSRIIDSHTATPAEVNQKIYQSVHFLALIQIFNLKQEMQQIYYINAALLVNNNKSKAWHFQQDLILLGLL